MGFGVWEFFFSAEHTLYAVKPSIPSGRLKFSLGSMLAPNPRYPSLSYVIPREKKKSIIRKTNCLLCLERLRRERGGRRVSNYCTLKFGEKQLQGGAEAKRGYIYEDELHMARIHMIRKISLGPISSKEWWVKRRTGTT